MQGPSTRILTLVKAPLMCGVDLTAITWDSVAYEIIAYRGQSGHDGRQSECVKLSYFYQIKHKW